MVHGSQFKIHWIPAIRVSPGLPIIVMTRDAYIQIPSGFGGREHREQDWNGAPVREEVPLIIVRPGVLAKRVIGLYVYSK